jgi:hypothetical protein
MESDERSLSEFPGISSGPLKIYRQNDRIFVTGFGLWLEVETEAEGLELIAELEDEGYRICY